MRRGSSRALWAMIAAATVIHVIVAAVTSGLAYDVHSFELVRRALDSHPLHVYSIVNPFPTFHWPYPPGFFPFVWAIDSLDSLFGGGFTHLIRVPAIVADAGLTWLVWAGLAGRVDERGRMLAAGLVAFGPVFITISGYATQIDSVAILPAVAALLVWEKLDGEWKRAIAAGALIGIAGAIKTVPLLMLLALLPTSRSPRETLTLLGAAAAVMLISLAPFLIADSSGVLGLRRYAGSPGVGGLSLLLQPDLAQAWITHLVPFSALTTWLFLHHSWIPNFVFAVAFLAFAVRVRPEPRQAAVLLWLLVLAFSSGFFFQYLIWLLPFLLLAGYTGATALLQALVMIPMLIFYLAPWHTSAVVYVYVIFMLLVWAGWAWGAVWVARHTSARLTARTVP